jgi:hypothetical protein
MVPQLQLKVAFLEQWWIRLYPVSDNYNDRRENDSVGRLFVVPSSCKQLVVGKAVSRVGGAREKINYSVILQTQI